MHTKNLSDVCLQCTVIIVLISIPVSTEDIICVTVYTVSAWSSCPPLSPLVLVFKLYTSKEAAA